MVLFFTGGDREKQVTGCLETALDAKGSSSLVHVILSHFLVFVFSVSLADPLVFLSRQFLNTYVKVPLYFLHCKKGQKAIAVF